jgi:hypothetical protein
LREHQDIEGIIGDQFQGGMYLPVHIHGIGDLLKGEKGDPDGKGYPCPVYGIHTQVAKCRIEIIDKEIGILEIQQQANVQSHRCSQEPALYTPRFPVHYLHNVKVEENGAQHDKYKCRSSPGIEKDTGKQGERIFSHPGKQVIYDQKDREEV